MQTSRYCPPRPDAPTRSSIIEAYPLRLHSPVRYARDTIWPFIDGVRNTGMNVWQAGMAPPSCACPTRPVSGLGIYEIEPGYGVKGLGRHRGGDYPIWPIPVAGFGQNEMAPGGNVWPRAFAGLGQNEMAPGGNVWPRAFAGVGIHTVEPGYGVQPSGFSGVTLGLADDTTQPATVAAAVTKIAEKFAEGKPATIKVRGKRLKVHADKATSNGFINALATAARNVVRGHRVTVRSRSGSAAVCPPLPRTVVLRNGKQMKVHEPAPPPASGVMIREVSERSSVITPTGPLPAVAQTSADQYVETVAQNLPPYQQYGTAYRRQIYAEPPVAYTSARAMIEKKHAPSPFARTNMWSQIPIQTAAKLSMPAMRAMPPIANTQMATARGYMLPFMRKWT